MPRGDIIDYSKIPSLEKLVTTDYNTLVNCKKLLNKGRNREELIEAANREGRALVDAWLDEEFPMKMMNYM